VDECQPLRSGKPLPAGAPGGSTTKAIEPGFNFKVGLCRLNPVRARFERD